MVSDLRLPHDVGLHERRTERETKLRVSMKRLSLRVLSNMNTTIRLALVSSVAVSAMLLAPTTASASRISSCTLVVKGKTYITGPCDFEDIGGGSFILRDLKLVIGCDVDNNNKIDATDDCAGAEERVFHKGAFVYVNVSATNTADGSWNETTGTHAHSPLGVLKRSGSCWSNKNAKVCARK